MIWVKLLDMLKQSPDFHMNPLLYRNLTGMAANSIVSYGLPYRNRIPWSLYEIIEEYGGGKSHEPIDEQTYNEEIPDKQTSEEQAPELIHFYDRDCATRGIKFYG